MKWSFKVMLISHGSFTIPHFNNLLRTITSFSTLPFINHDNGVIPATVLGWILLPHYSDVTWDCSGWYHRLILKIWRYIYCVYFGAIWRWYIKRMLYPYFDSIQISMLYATDAHMYSRAVSAISIWKFYNKMFSLPLPPNEVSWNAHLKI